MDRKRAIAHIAGVLAAGPFVWSGQEDNGKRLKKLNNLRHSVCRWPYNEIPLGRLCEMAIELGIESVELLDPEDIRMVQGYGLNCAIANQVPLSIADGFNDPKNHEHLQQEYLRLLPELADLGIDQVICFSGNRKGISDEDGLEYCARGLDPVVKEAEKRGVKLVMELLNSKVDHPDYQCDRTQWGVTLCDKMGSDHFKLLYDIYHMQIMEGDVIRTIQQYHSYISHYHTGGVPGRNELDKTQELNYNAIVSAITETGYEGYIGQEFIPTGDPKTSLREALTACKPI